MTGAETKPADGAGHETATMSRLVQKAPHTNRMPYAAVRTEPATTASSAMRPHTEPPSASSRRAARAPSLATKPTVGMIPTMDAIDTIAAVARAGA